MGVRHFKQGKPDFESILPDIFAFFKHRNIEVSQIFVVGGYARQICDIGEYYYSNSLNERVSEIKKELGDVDLLAICSDPNGFKLQSELEQSLNDGKETYHSVMEDKDYMIEVTINQWPTRGSNGQVCEIFPKFDPFYNPDEAYKKREST